MRLRFWRERETRSTSGLANPAPWLNIAMGGGGTFAGPRVSPQKALDIGAIWAAVSTIAETVGSLGLKVYRELEEGQREEARAHRAWSMLHDRPNANMPADRFWSTVTVQLLLFGNAFLLKGRNEMGLVDELWLLDPAEITINWNPRDPTSQKFYIWETLGEKRVFTDEDLVHITGMTLNGIMGESPISRCRQTFGTAIARDEFEGNFYRRGAVLSGVLEYAGQLSDKAKENIRDSFADLYSGSKNSHKVPIFEEGLTFKPLGALLKDLDFVAAQQLSRTDIALIFKLPPSYLGGSTGDSLTYATRESNAIEFAQRAIMPWTVHIEKALSTDPSIFPQSVFYPEFLFESLLRADSQARGDYYEKAIKNGWMTKNEIRSKENLPPIEEEAPVPPPPVVPDFPPAELTPSPPGA